MLQGEARQIRFTGPSEITDPMTVTVDERLIPSRDGFFARLDKNMLKHGAIAVIGTTIGAGAFAVKEYIFPLNNTVPTPKPMNQTISTPIANTDLESDSDMDNPL